MHHDHLEWPFFDDAHRKLATDLDAWCDRHVDPLVAGDRNVDDTCRALVARLGEGGWLRYVTGAPGKSPGEGIPDVRSICLIRETLSRHSGLADFAFAMQGLGSGPIVLSGDYDLREQYLPAVADGGAITAFAISEEDAGSDVAAITTTAAKDGSDYVIDGEKTWISNTGLATFYVVFARTGEAPGAKGLSAFVVDADTPGLDASQRIEVISPHPLGTLRFDGVRVPASRMVGAPGKGFRVAMGTLDVFRPSVGAAALGFARRALEEAVNRARERRMFGKTLSEFQMTQSKVAEMATRIDASALLVYRAAWMQDRGRERVTRESAMAKLFSTESAQRVIDDAVQIFGGLGVVTGMPVEELYRDIRPLRIYEGTSEIQRLIIARETFKS